MPDYIPERRLMMKRFVIFVMLAAVLVFAIAIGGCGKSQDSKPAMASVNMQEGQWEMAMQVNIPGMPAGSHPAHVITTCLSKKDYVPQDKQKSDCKVQDNAVNGNTVSWAVVCPNMTGKGSITYAGTTFDGTTEATMKVDGKDMVVKTAMKGKYLGPCPPTQEKK